VNTAREALALRAWAADLLLNANGRTVPRVSEASWKYFCVMEFCAAPLQKVVPSEVMLAECARAEIQRAASVRASLQQLALLARQHGFKIIVLKGGVTVASGRDVHVEDLDVLCNSADARRLAESLGAHSKGDEWVAPAAVSRIEIHDRIEQLTVDDRLFDRAIPLAAVPGLWQLQPTDHLWHLLLHSVAQHVDRAGRLRDLLVLRAALESAAPADVSEVAARAARHERSNSMLAVLAVARGQWRELPHNVEDSVRRRYFLVAMYGWVGRFGVGTSLLTHAVNFTARPWMPAVRFVFKRPKLPSAAPGMHRLYSLAPHLDNVLRQSARPFVLVLSALMALTAFAVERLYSRRVAVQLPATTPEVARQ
jgi:hypothetical protein